MPDVACLLCRWRTPADVRSRVCHPCVIREARRLSEIVALYALLPAALPDNPVTIIDLTYPPVGGASAPAVSRCDACVKRGHPAWVIPCTHDKPGYDQLGDINVAAVLDSWVRDWCETLGYSDPPRVPTVSRLAGWLQIWLAMACREHDAIDEYARDIRVLAAKMRRAINRDLSPVRYEAPCPYCGTKTLRREPGGDWIECGGCGRLWGEDEYAFLARTTIHPDQMLTTEEAAVVAQVEVGTVRVAAHRRKLTAQYVEGDTRPRYRKGDVEAWAGRMVA